MSFQAVSRLWLVPQLDDAPLRDSYHTERRTTKGVPKNEDSKIHYPNQHEPVCRSPKIPTIPFARR